MACQLACYIRYMIKVNLSYRVRPVICGFATNPDGGIRKWAVKYGRVSVAIFDYKGAAVACAARRNAEEARRNAEKSAAHYNLTAR